MSDERQRIKKRLLEIAEERKSFQGKISDLSSEEYNLWHQEYEIDKREGRA